jgi:hypothetical protein
VETDPINSNFEEIGFESSLFLYNLGSMVLAFIAFPIMSVLALVMKYCCFRKSWMHKWGDKTLDELFWSNPILTF